MTRSALAVCACPECKMPIYPDHTLCVDCEQAECTTLIAACVPYDAAAVLAAWSRNGAPPPCPPLDSSLPAVEARRALIRAFKARGVADPASQDDWCHEWLVHHGQPVGPDWGLGTLTPVQARAALADLLTPPPDPAACRCGVCPACMRRKIAATQRIGQGEVD